MVSVAIVGSRNLSEDGRRKMRVLFELLREKYGRDVKIVTGDARGADAYAYELFKEFGFKEFEQHIAQWDRYGKRAGPIRNEKIWENADFGYAFWDGKSPGTKSSIKIAKRLGKPVEVIRIGQVRSPSFDR